jgi:hypothetical protein
MFDLDTQFGEFGVGDRRADHIGPHFHVGLGNDVDECRVVG